jgi:hypothetical protein
MLYSEIIAVCSQIHTKHTVWAERRILNVKTWWYVKHSNDCALKRVNGVKWRHVPRTALSLVYNEADEITAQAMNARHSHYQQ